MILSCAENFYHTLLSLASNSLLLYKKTAMIISLSLKCFTVYFSMEIFIGYLKTFPLEKGGDQKGKSAYVCVRRGRGSNYCHFDAYVLID